MFENHSPNTAFGGTGIYCLLTGSSQWVKSITLDYDNDDN